MAKIYRRIIESHEPPTPYDLWMRHTKCGAELLYFDPMIQRWHAYHYITYADEILGLKEMLEQMLDDKLEELDTKVKALETKITSLETKANSLEQKLNELDNEDTEESGN